MNITGLPLDSVIRLKALGLDDDAVSLSSGVLDYLFRVRDVTRRRREVAPNVPAAVLCVVLEAALTSELNSSDNPPVVKGVLVENGLAVIRRELGIEIETEGGTDGG